MKYLTTISIILTLCCAKIHAQSPVKNDTLWNSTIVSLTKIGLPPNTIINKIRTSYSSFDVSTNALIELASQGVNGDVINEMMNVVENHNSSIQSKIIEQSPDITKQRPGIYYYDPNSQGKPYKRIEPTVVSGTSSNAGGAAIAQAYTYGLAKSSVKKTVAGMNSRTQIFNKKPAFYFVFDVSENKGSFNQDNWFFASATSPNEFILVQFTIRKSSREVVTSSGNAYNSNYGVPDQYKIDFEYEEVQDGIYKVTPKNELSVGEYFWGYASTPPSQYTNNKLFDFGIDQNK